MSVNWRFVGICAAGAFLLSFFTGLVSGVSFGVILLRASLGAVIFALGSAAAWIAISRYVPDLLAVAPGRQGGVGQNIDLSVGDEDDGDSPAATPDETKSHQTGVGGFDDSLVEEVEESFSADGEAEVDDVDYASEGGTSEADTSEGGTSEGYSDRKFSSAGQPDEEDGVAAEEDDLPDLGGFAGSFESAGADSGGLSSIDGDSSRSSDSGMDPKTMAEALRTVLKREE